MAGSGLATLSIYSFAAGFVACLILIIAFCIFKGLRAGSAASPSERRREVLQPLFVFVLIGGSLVSWTIGFHKPSQPAIAYPYTWKFWDLLLNLVSFSFGIERFSAGWGVICLLIVLFPLCGLVWKRKWRLSNGEWAILACTFGIIAVHSSIAMGRAGFSINYSKNQEYAEHGMPLIVLSVLGWSIFLENRKRLKGAVLAGLWLFCFLTFSNNWRFDICPAMSAQQLLGVQCARAFYSQHGDGRCPSIYPPENGLWGHLESAKLLNTSFYQEIIANDTTSK